ncbi:MAG: hypothetical protein H8E61_09470, partial [Bacteroidetes bacterium]|nr:hypothetical protein [Bacteroidota bacterium]
YRKSAVDHLVNGVSIRDPITGTANLHFQQSLGDYETEFKPGGLDARYGSTRGGIVSYQMLKPRNKRTSSVLIGTSNGVSKTKEDLLNWEVYHASSYRDKLYCSLDISGYESKGYRSNESFSSFNYALNASYRISSRLKISTFYLNQQLDYQDGYNHDYSLTISEDRQSQFLPHYLIDYDMADNGYRDGMVDLDDIPPELLSWLNTPGLQQEDTDDDNRVDLFFETETYTDWNNNGQFDPGEWFIDVNGDGMYSEFLNEDIDGDGDNRMEDLNNNWWLDSESIFDSWYGNGSLDTEDLNFNGILDPGEDLNNDGLIQSEDINHDGEMSRYSMFSRLPWHQENREIVTFKVTFQPTPKIYGWFQYSRYNLKKLSNTIEYVNEDRNYNDLLDDGEDLNGNGILDPYHHGYEIEGARDSKDMFSDYNNDGIVDQSVRDNDLDGDIDEDDWIYWDEVYTTLHWWQNYGMFRGVSTDRPNGYPSGGWSYDKYAIENIQLHYVHQYNHKGRLYCGFDHSWYDLLHNNEEEVNSLGFTVDPTPVNTAGYISTRYEVLPTFSFTAGFRFDLMTSAEDRLEDSWDPTWSQWDNDNWGGDGINQYYNEAADDAGLYIHSLGEPRVKHRNKYAVKISPRVGLNFSPSFGTTLFVNYGHYRTKPYFLEELLKYNYDNRLLTRSFEFGVRHKINRKWFTEFLIYDSVEYDTRDIYLSETARPFEFYLKGQQVKLFWYPSRLLNVELTYLHSNPEFYSDEQEGYSSWIPVIDAIRYNAEWSQKHTVFGKLDLGGRYRKATIVFNYGSGTKYTIPGQGADITLNSGELPSKYWFDGMISSTHHVGS